MPLGLAFAWFNRERLGERKILLPLVVAAAMLAVFAIGPIFGLPLIGRYVRTPAILLALFYGLAVAGWLLLPQGSRERRIWMAVGAVALLASLAFIPKQAKMLDGLDKRFRQDGRLYADLEKAGEDPKLRAAFAACGRLTSADHRPIPFIRFALDGAWSSVETTAKNASPLGRLLLVPRRDNRNVRRFYKENFPRRTARKPPGWTTLYANRSWRVYAAPGGCGA